MPAPADPAVRNLLLAALPESERAPVIARLTPRWLTRGEVLYEPDTPLTHVYFPTSVLVSLFHANAADLPVKLALIGHEGLVGIALTVGELRSPFRAIVSRTGWAYGVSGASLKEVTDHSAMLLPLLLRYTQRLVAQMAQSTICASQHSLDERVCRWLLQRLDRMDGDELNVTHQAMAEFVGVPPAVLTVALAAMRASGLLHHSKGHITVVNRAGIQARVCKCYRLMEQEPQQPLLPQR